MKTTWILLLLCLAGCGHHNDILLEKVYQTSDRLECTKVFSATRKQIVELNEILIQTGTTDMPDDRVINAAVIHVHACEIMLKQVSASQSGGNFKEVYSGEGYRLELNYKAGKLPNSIIYTGNCRVSYGDLRTEMNVEGVSSNL